MDPAQKRRVSVCVPRIAYCTSSKKSYASVTCSITFSSLSLSHSPATNFVGQAHDSDHRRSVVHLGPAARCRGSACGTG